MNNPKYNPKFKTTQSCQEILNNPNSTPSDKDTATSRIAEIISYWEKKNQSPTKSNSTLDEPFSKEIQQEADLIAISHRLTVKRFPKMSQEDYTFGTIVNATANRILEIRKVNSICKIAEGFNEIPPR